MFAAIGHVLLIWKKLQSNFLATRSEGAPKTHNTVYEGAVRREEEGTAVFRSDAGLELVLPVGAAPGERLCLGLRAEDVLLAADVPGRLSARNSLPARVVRCERAGSDVFVHLATDAGGEQLVAKLTPAAERHLELAPGREVHAVVKAQSLRRIA